MSALAVHLGKMSFEEMLDMAEGGMEFEDIVFELAQTLEVDDEELYRFVGSVDTGYAGDLSKYPPSERREITLGREVGEAIRLGTLLD